MDRTIGMISSEQFKWKLMRTFGLILELDEDFFRNLIVWPKKLHDAIDLDVAFFLNEEKPIRIYELTLYANNLTSGIYFYRIQAGNFIETKKMILMK